MKVFNIASNLHSYLRSRKKLQIGFVPTMGALHNGHLSLVKKSTSENDLTVVSIFVNPTQFGEKADLEKYPRPIEKDLSMLELAGVDCAFVPEVSEVYPENFKEIDIDLGNLENTLEGKQRPGHFKGVCNVVYRLFDIVKPNRAYFGQKDFQQTVVIRKLITEKKLDIDLRIIPIVRENHGLAMSSRNQRLTSDCRKNASFIYQTLGWAKSQLKTLSLEEIIHRSKQKLSEQNGATVEYFEAINGIDMKPVDSLVEAPIIAIVCVVKYCGVRLLDNIILKSEQ